ncbi:MAG TPA: hypothetical protein VFA39_15460 [Steroidobacteraceae bacterium]|nr:hypothetical protein [Steroidobacteraceae bacterium]
MWIPDTQLRRGVPVIHIRAAANAIVEYLPDVIFVAGDWWDMPSLNKHNEAGSIHTEGTRIKDDIDFGNEQFDILVAPMNKEIARREALHKRRWNPEREFLFGNHEHRLTRAIAAVPQFEGVLSLDMMKTPGFTRHPFLEIVEKDGIWFSHYFSNTLSGRAIGGSIDNRLNKIGHSFVQGHQQGRLYGSRQFPGKVERHGLVAGSFYLHDEDYRDVQSNGEWRGIVIMNEVANGKYDIMPLSMDYLLRKFGE